MDAIINFAAISNDPVGDLNPETTYSVNTDDAIHHGPMATAIPDLAIPWSLLPTLVSG
jgi:hypothetical protein